MGQRLIVVIVNKSLAGRATEITKIAGAKGGTVIKGLGSSSFEKKGFFGLDIEEEKCVILIVSPTENSQAIMDALNREIGFENSNTGVAFVLNAETVIGVRT
jgi:nitrogen regulatory protein PII